MMIPTIHLNGTSKDELLRQLLDAGDALTTAIRALTQCTPNGRDYYPQGPEAFTLAHDEHYRRMDRLQDVLAELSEMAEKVSDL